MPATLFRVNTIPLWVPLVVAMLGLIGTLSGALGGVIITQRRSDRRERASQLHALEREKARWAREDEARTFEQRRDAYAAIYEAVRDTNRSAGEWTAETKDTEALFRALKILEMYGTPRVVRAARQCWHTTIKRGNAVIARRGGPEYSVPAYQAQKRLVAEIRKELRIPDEPLSDQLP